MDVGELRRDDGEPVPLRPKATSVLIELVKAADRLVPRDRLLEAGWGDSYVDEDAALHTAIREIRQALDDSASDPRFVATVHGRGYRFIADVRPDVDSPEEETPPSEGDHLFDRRAVRVAILLLAVATAFGTGWILRPTSDPAAAETSLLDASDAVLEARYLLEVGTASAVGEAATILREIVESGSPSAYAWSGLAVAEWRLGHVERARVAAMKTLETRPLDGPANRVLGLHAIVLGDPEEAERHLLRALEVDPSSGHSQRALAAYRASMGRLDEALRLAEQAVSLAPNNSIARADLAHYLMSVGRFQEALEQARRVSEAADLLPGVRFASLETLQAAAWQLEMYELARDAAVDYARGHGASEAVTDSFMQLEPRAGAVAAIHWRIDDHLARAPEHPGHRVWAALLLAQLGELEHAASELAEAAAADPPPAVLRLSREDPRLIRILESDYYPPEGSAGRSR